MVDASFSRKVRSSCLMDNPSSSRTSLIEVVKGGAGLSTWYGSRSHRVLDFQGMSAHVRAFYLDPQSPCPNVSPGGPSEPPPLFSGALVDNECTPASPF